MHEPSLVRPPRASLASAGGASCNGAVDTTSRPPGRVWRPSSKSKNSLQSSHDRVYAPYAGGVGQLRPRPAKPRRDHRQTKQPSQLTVTSGPHFFVPYVDDSANAEKVWQRIKTLMEDRHGWPRVSKCRIFRLDYGQSGAREVAQVGEPHCHGHPPAWDYDEALEITKAREVVVAILENEGGPYLICTHNRGLAGGGPILIGTDQPVTVAYFGGHGPTD